MNLENPDAPEKKSLYKWKHLLGIVLLAILIPAGISGGASRGILTLKRIASEIIVNIGFSSKKNVIPADNSEIIKQINGYIRYINDILEKEATVEDKRTKLIPLISDCARCADNKLILSIEESSVYFYQIAVLSSSIKPIYLEKDDTVDGLPSYLYQTTMYIKYRYGNGTHDKSRNIEIKYVKEEKGLKFCTLTIIK